MRNYTYVGEFTNTFEIELVSRVIPSNDHIIEAKIISTKVTRKYLQNSQLRE